MLRGADVMLDPFPFGGGVTSLQGFAVGTPIVTLPAQFLRGRLTLSMFQRMEEAVGADVADGDVSSNGAASPHRRTEAVSPKLSALVAQSLDDYVKIAVRVGRDAEYRDALASSIRRHAHVLFEDEVAVSEWERFFAMARSRRRSDKLE